VGWDGRLLVVLERFAESEFQIVHGLERSEILKSDIGHLESKSAPALAQ
jgi:hypothetical protein